MKKLLFLLLALTVSAPAFAQTQTQYYTVPTIAALKAMTTSRPAVVQVVDANPGIFNLSTGACAAADDIFQVQPTSGTTVCYTRLATPYSAGKGSATNVLTSNGSVPSWSSTLPAVTAGSALVTATGTVTARSLAARAAATFNVKDFGAACTGAVDDQPAFALANTAAAALGGGVIAVPPNCRLESTVTVGAGVTFQGTGKYVTSVYTGAANITAFNLSSTGANLLDMQINAGAYVNTSGCVVSVSNGQGSQIRNVSVLGAFNSFCADGSVLTTFANNDAAEPAGATTGTPVSTSGACYKVSGASTVNAYLYYNWCRGVDATHQPYAAIWITGGGGHVLVGNQAVYPGNGIVIAPTATLLTWMFLRTNVMDSGTGTGLLVETATSGGLIGLSSDGDWYASFTLDGVKTTKGAATVLDDVRLNTAIIKSNRRNGVNFVSGDNLAVNGGSVCNNSIAGDGSYDGIATGTGTTKVSITNVGIGNCASGLTYQNYPINTNSSTITIVGNDVSTGNNFTAINYGTTPTTKVVSNNLGLVDDLSAASVTAPSGNLTLRSASAQTVVLGPTGGASDLYVQGTGVLPSVTNTMSSGSGSLRWSNVYSVLGNFSGATTIGGALTYGGVTLSGVTGTGSMVLSASPTFTGTATSPSFTATGATTSLALPIGNANTIGQTASTSHLAGNAGSVTFGISDGGGFAGVKVTNVWGGTYSSQRTSILCDYGGVFAATECTRFEYDGSVVLGLQSANATTNTTGYVYIRTSAGAPTGVPTAYTGMVALQYDTTNKKLWVYDGGWLQPKTPAGAAIVTWQ